METKRRSALKRFNRKPKTHLKGTDRQLAILELLRDNRYLATPYIQAALGSPQYVEDVLPDLVEKGYIGVPAKAIDRCKTHAVPHAYELLPRGEELLAQKRGPKPRHIAGNWFEHDFLTCCHKFSFEHAARVVPGLKVRTAHSILEHENCPEATRLSPTPFVIPTDPPLEFDADPFGYEYEGKLLFCYFETDTGTHKRADVKHKIDRACEFLERKMAVTMFGMPSKLMHFFFITNNEERMEDFSEHVPDDWASRFHFKWTPCSFETKFPPPTAHLVLEPWHQKGGKTWSIPEHLGATDVRPSEGRSDQAA